MRFGKTTKGPISCLKKNCWKKRLRSPQGGLLFVFLFSSLTSMAQPVAPEKGLKSDDPSLKRRIEKVTRGARKVDRVKEGLLIFQSKRNIKEGTRVILHRADGDTLDILAWGQVVGSQGTDFFIELELDSVIKAPIAGDYITVLGAPPDGGEEDAVKKGGLKAEEAPLPPDPGFIDILSGSTQGSLDVTSSDQTNAFKGPSSYSLNNFQFTWYFEFVWRLGLTYESWSGFFPTSTYFRNSGNSDWSGTEMALNFRFRKMYQYFRPTLRFLNFNEEFISFNPDEALISSRYTGLGGGVRLAGEFCSMTWAPKVKYIDFNLAEAFLDVNYLQLEVIDTGSISRGTNGAATGLSWKLGMTGMMYIPWIPWIKRFVLITEYGQKEYSMNFSGPTESEEGGIYIVPENGTYSETFTYYRWMVGVRLDDFIGQFFMPR